MVLELTDDEFSSVALALFDRYRKIEKLLEENPQDENELADQLPIILSALKKCGVL